MSTPAPGLAIGKPSLIAQGKWRGAGFFSATQDIRQGATWTIQRDVDTVIVHLGGPIRRLETELDGCGAIADPPMAGDVWIVPAGQRYVSIASGGLVHYAELHLDRSAITSIAGRPVPRRPLRPRAGCYDSFLHGAAVRLEQLARRAGDIHVLSAESLSQAVLFDFYCRYEGAPATPPSARKIRFSASERHATENYIRERLASPLRLDDLAAHVQMTPHEFLIAFRAAFGTTPAQYIIEQRLRRARWLLESSSRTVADIAFETGFASHAHLSSTFRRRLGITPQGFRRKGPAGASSNMPISG